MPKLLIALFLLGLISCSSPKTLSGYYRSNFAELGFFQTRIRFKTTDSLQYIFSGDMIYDSTVGHYNIFKNKLYITFKKVDIDTSIVGGAHDRFDSPLKFDTVGSNIIAYQSLFYIGNNKLFGTNVETGRKTTKISGHHELRKYVLFGSYYYNKKFYLKKKV